MQHPAQEIAGHIHALQKQGSIEPMSLITQEGVLGIEFMPFVSALRYLQRLTDHLPPGKRHMWVLPPPDHQRLSPQFAHTGQRIILFPVPQRMGMDVGGIETHRSPDPRVQCGAESQVPAQAYPIVARAPVQ